MKWFNDNTMEIVVALTRAAAIAVTLIMLACFVVASVLVSAGPAASGVLLVPWAALLSWFGFYVWGNASWYPKRKKED